MKKLVKNPRIPAAMIIALGQYFMGQLKTNPQLISKTIVNGIKSEEWREGLPWNKEEAIKRIEAATPKHVTWSAIAGTFWIHRQKSKWVYEISKETWPLAEKKPARG